MYVSFIGDFLNIHALLLVGVVHHDVACTIVVYYNQGYSVF